MRGTRVSRAGSAVVAVAALIAGVTGFLAGPASATPLISTGTSYAVIGTIAIGHPAGSLAVDPDTQVVYVVDGPDNAVTAIDTATNAVIATIPVGSNPAGLAVDPGLHRAYVANHGTQDLWGTAQDTVSVIDTLSNTVIDTISVGAGPLGVAVDTGNHKVYVTNYMYPEAATVIDPTTDPTTVTNTDYLGSRPWAVAVDSRSHLAYATTLFGGSVSVLDGPTIKNVVCCFNGPAMVAVDSGTEHAYVAAGGPLYVLDTVTNTIIDTVAGVENPGAMAVDDARHTAYITNPGGGTVTVIDTTDNHVLANVSVGPNPGSITVDSATHRVYVSNGDGTLSVISPLAGQQLRFLSSPLSVPVPGGTYDVLVAGGGSGNPVELSIDADSAGTCSVEDGTVTFEHAGRCVVDANQAGDSHYSPAPQLQQAIKVYQGEDVVNFTTRPPTSAVVGTTYSIGTRGGPSAQPVTLTVSPTTTDGACSLDGTTVHFVHPGLCAINADQAGDADYEDAPTKTQAIAVVPAATSTTLTTSATTLTARVAVVAPGAGTPTGTVTFSVAGEDVGHASLTNGIADLHYVRPSGADVHVGAVYSGDADFTGSSDSTSHSDPVLTATLRSAQRRTNGWYRAPVTVTFHCTARGAALTTACPAPVTLAANRAGRAVTRTIAATDGGLATVVVSGINVDRQAPHVSVRGVRAGATYDGTAPTARCAATDALSGLSRCTVRTTTRAGRATVVATAVDRAGNRRSATVRFTRLPIYLQGVTPSHGAYPVTAGRTYTVVVVGSSHRPHYYDAAIYPKTPFIQDHSFRAAGPGRWTLRVTMTANLRSHRYWNIGVKTGSTLHVLKIRVRGR